MENRQPPPLPPDVPVIKKQSDKALAALMMGITGIIIFPLSFAAIITGHIARKECMENPELKGSGMALAGMILGYLYVGIILICTVAACFTLFWHGKNTLKEEVSGALKWTRVEGITDADITDILFDGNRFVAVTDDGNFLKSNDGVYWTSTGVNERAEFTSLAMDASGNIGVAIAEDEVFVYDGSECWLRNGERPDHKIGRIVHTEEMFAGSTDGGVVISADGKVWEYIAIEGIEGVPSIRWCDPQIVIQECGTVKTSNDGKVWEALQTKSRPSMYFWRGRLFGADMSKESVYTLQDNDWERVANPAKGMLSHTDFLHGTDSYLFSFGSTIMWTSDGINWGGMETPESLWRVNAVAEGNGRVVMVADNGFIMIGVTPDKVSNVEVSVNTMYAGKKRYEGYPEGFFSTNKNPKQIERDVSTGIMIDPSAEFGGKMNEEMCLKAFMDAVSSKNRGFKTEMKKVLGDDSDTSGMYLVFRTLEERKFLLLFDWEAGTYPVPYEWLVDSVVYMAKQQGIPITDMAVETGEDTCTGVGEYRISWKIRENRYGISFQDESDWYSYQVFEAIEVSMIQEGYPHRFVSLDPESDFGTYTFCDPEKLELWLANCFQ